MKIGITPSGFERFGEERYAKLRAIGFACVDFGMADTGRELYHLTGEELDTAIRNERELAASAGITISQIHGPWRWPARDTTEEERAERLEKMIHSIRVTAKLGCRYWVVHPIMPFGIEERDTELADKTWEMNLAFMSKLLAVAREENIVICLENMPMPNFSMGSPEAILRFVETMNDEHFKICLDTGHVAVFPQLRLGDEVRRLGNNIRVLHVHDNSGRGDEHKLPYRGVIDWADFLAALQEIGFDGAFSLELAMQTGAPLPELEAEYRNAYAIAANMLKI